MFETFCAPVGPLMALTPDAVARISGLDFVPVKDRDDLPAEPGVYLWATDWAGPCFYFGSGAGASGLRGRVGNEFRWVREYLDWMAKGDPFETEAVTQVPLVRVVADLKLKCFAAAAAPASWESEHQAPSSAVEWERFVQETSALLTGHRSIIGGGAWENKVGGLGDRMQKVALARLRALRPRKGSSGVVRR